MVTDALPAPGPKRSQRERREHTRSALLDATIGCLTAYGYQATTTRRVAEMAGVANGALAYHFPTRLDLIGTTLDEIGARLVANLHAQIATLPTARTTRTRALLDLLWSGFRGELFGAWLKVWLAAAEDPDLHTALAPIDARMSAAISQAIAELAPSHLSRDAWNRRATTVLLTLRGLAVNETFRPGLSSGRDPWSAVRDELTALIDR